MANSKYDEGREATAEKQIDYDGDTLRLYLCDQSYYDIAWDPGADPGEEFIGFDHTFADVIGILDTVDLSNVDVTDSTYEFGAGWITSDPVTASGLAVGEDSVCAVLRDVATGHLLAFYDTFTNDQPWELIGDGTPQTLNPPLRGWMRI
jgi:hypothetical protein